MSAIERVDKDTADIDSGKQLLRAPEPPTLAMLLTGAGLTFIVSDGEGQNPRLQATALARARRINFGDGGISSGRAHCI